MSLSRTRRAAMAVLLLLKKMDEDEWSAASILISSQPDTPSRKPYRRQHHCLCPCLHRAFPSTLHLPRSAAPHFRGCKTAFAHLMCAVHELECQGDTIFLTDLLQRSPHVFVGRRRSLPFSHSGNPPSCRRLNLKPQCFCARLHLRWVL